MKFFKLLMATAVALTLGTSMAEANIQKGQKVYLKKLKGKCSGMNGAKFAAMHTQDEWEEFKEEGTLVEEIGTICPKAQKLVNNPKFQEKSLPHIYDFIYEYGSDSGNVPACG